MRRLRHSVEHGDEKGHQLGVGMYRIFASVLNSGPNSVFVFERIVSSDEYE